MKFSRVLLLSVLLLNVALSARAGSPRGGPIVGHLPGRSGLLAKSGTPTRIALGSTREDVEKLLGAANARVGEDDWIYWDCRVAPLEANPLHYDALLIHFTAQRVATLKVVDGALLRALLKSATRDPLR